MTFPTVISWSWGADEYHEGARSLIEDCERYGYQHNIEVDAPIRHHMDNMPDGDHWTKRQWLYRYIPHFIAWKMFTLERPVLYLHADMSIREPIPDGTFEGMDIGLESGWSQRPPRPDDRVLAAPIYLANTPASWRFLRVWLSLCQNTDDGRGEHEQLLHVWRIFTHDKETCLVKTFDPPLGSIRADSDVPIVGTK